MYREQLREASDTVKTGRSDSESSAGRNAQILAPKGSEQAEMVSLRNSFEMWYDKVCSGDKNALFEVSRSDAKESWSKSEKSSTEARRSPKPKEKELSTIRLSPTGSRPSSATVSTSFQGETPTGKGSKREQLAGVRRDLAMGVNALWQGPDMPSPRYVARANAAGHSHEDESAGSPAIDNDIGKAPGTAAGRPATASGTTFGVTAAFGNVSRDPLSARPSTAPARVDGSLKNPLRSSTRIGPISSFSAGGAAGVSRWNPEVERWRPLPAKRAGTVSKKQVPQKQPPTTSRQGAGTPADMGQMWARVCHDGRKHGAFATQLREFAKGGKAVRFTLCFPPPSEFVHSPPCVL